MVIAEQQRHKKNGMIYLTFNDSPGGVFDSQVVDVIEFLSSQFQVRIKLVAFISIRNFLTDRRKIRQKCKDAIVLPMVPFLKNWKWNFFPLFLVCLLLRPKAIIGRGVFAAYLGMMLKRIGLCPKVCFDGRGAYTAEWEEYLAAESFAIKNYMHIIERSVITCADFRIAVSHKLVDYWRERFGYQQDKHVVIPCTVEQGFLSREIEAEEARLSRKKLGLGENDLVLVYSGSAAGWQSFPILQGLLKGYLAEDIKHKVLFFLSEEQNVLNLRAEFPEQVVISQVPHKEILPLLAAGDYALLIREGSVTNHVASPTKFAEYLAAGLPVIISEGIGDLSVFVNEHDCGLIVRDAIPTEKLASIVNEKKQKMRNLAQKYFSKQAFKNEYSQILKALGVS